jgi:hypothetical protein
MTAPISSAFGKVNAEYMLDKSLMFGCGIFSKIGIRNILQEVTEQCKSFRWRENTVGLRRPYQSYSLEIVSESVENRPGIV